MKSLGLGILLALVLGAVTTLYRFADLEAAGAARFAAALTALRLHDAGFNRDLLRLRHGDLTHYDTVNAAIRAIEADLRALAAAADELAPEVAVLRLLARHKRERLEAFKSDNALVRNSLAYVVHRQEELARRHPALTALGAALLRFLRHPDERRRREVTLQLSHLPTGGEFDSLSAHVRLILERLPRLEATLGELLNTPLGAVARRLADVHLATQTRLQRRADAFRLGLYLAALAFLGYLLVTLARLHRANRRLQAEMGRRLETERQLLQAQKMEALGTLASGIAHDFNNLLTGLQGYAVLAREQLEAGRSPTDALGRIEAIVARGRELAARLLQFARPGGGRCERFAPGAVVAEALDFVRSALPSRVRLRFDDRLPAERKVTGRPGEWQQVVINLVHNAADAVGGDGEITVSLTATAEGVLLEVTDDGEGIAPERLATIFEPFASGKPAGSGSGLGLAIVERIVHAHGGRIEVESRPGRTVFRIRFPWQVPLQR